MNQFNCVAATIVIIMMSFALILCYLGISATNAAAIRDSVKPEYAVTTNPYLPIHMLEPVY
jgi:hypothetical protein